MAIGFYYCVVAGWCFRYLIWSLTGGLLDAFFLSLWAIIPRNIGRFFQWLGSGSGRLSCTHCIGHTNRGLHYQTGKL